VFLLLFVDVIEIPAVFFLGFWFLFQVLSGVGRVGESGGGVAFWAHIGGFITGVVTVALFRRPERQEVNWWNT
jgi:membrane associated rhomboid family serine protease